MTAKPLQRSDATLLESSPEPPLRRDLDHPLLVLRVHPEDGRRTFFGYASNISCLGLRIDATNPRDKGSVFELEIPLPAPLEGVARCTCEVVWKRDWAPGRSPGMGLRFLDISDDLSADLDAWVRQQTLLDLYRRHPCC